MKKCLLHILILSVAVISLALGGCVQEDIPACDTPTSPATVYLSLRLSLSIDTDNTRGTATRAEGDESTSEGTGTGNNEYNSGTGTGDSEDPEDPIDFVKGTELENNIDDLTIFILPSIGKTVDGKDYEFKYDDDTGNIITENLTMSQFDLPFTYALYVNVKAPNTRTEITRSIEENGEKVVTIKIALDKTTIENKTWAFVAVANMGDLSNKKINSLHDLRSYVDYNSFTRTGAVTATNFAMSSINIQNGGVLSPILGNGANGIDGSSEKPYKGECWLMRNAARIDIGTNAETENGDWTNFKYGKIVTGEDNTKEIEYTAYADPENPTEDTTIGTVYIQAAELINSMSKPSYALRHVRAAEGISSASSWNITDLECGGLLSRISHVETKYVIDPYFSQKTKDGNPASDWFGNSTPSDLHSNHGSHFSDKALVKNFIEQTTDKQDQGDYYGSGFNRTLTVDYTNENCYDNVNIDPTEIGDNFMKKYATGLAIKAVYVPAVVYKKKPSTGDSSEASGSTTTMTRTSGETEGPGDGYIEVEKGEFKKGDTFWRWRGKISEVEKSFYFADEASANSFNSAHSGTVKKYEDGISYYHLWIEHNNSTTDSPTPMKYAIVRNNVYRVLLQFAGPGGTVPFDKDEPKNMSWTIFTRAWNLRVQPEIVM